MGIPMGIPVGMGWVWGLKCHPHGSPARIRANWLRTKEMEIGAMELMVRGGL